MEKEMYEAICKDRFDKLEAGLDDMVNMLRGRDGKPGVVDDVRSLKKTMKQIGAVVIFVGGALMLELLPDIVNWIVR